MSKFEPATDDTIAEVEEWAKLGQEVQPGSVLALIARIRSLQAEIARLSGKLGR